MYYSTVYRYGECILITEIIYGGTQAFYYWKTRKGEKILLIYICARNHIGCMILFLSYISICVPSLKSIYSKQQKLVKYNVTIFTDVTVDNDIKVIT